jgi:hypothetical protein
MYLLQQSTEVPKDTALRKQKTAQRKRYSQKSNALTILSFLKRGNYLKRGIIPKKGKCH